MKIKKRKKVKKVKKENLIEFEVILSSKDKMVMPQQFLVTVKEVQK